MTYLSRLCDQFVHALNEYSADLTQFCRFAA